MSFAANTGLKCQLVFLGYLLLSVCKDYWKITLPQREGNSGGALSNILPVINCCVNGFHHAHLNSHNPQVSFLNIPRLTTSSL